MWTPEESFQIRLTARAKTLLAIGLAAAFAVAAAIGTTGALTAEPGPVFRPVLLAIFIPVTALVLAYAALPRFRHWVLGLDLRMLTLFQAWRVISSPGRPAWATSPLAWPPPSWPRASPATRAMRPAAAISGSIWPGSSTSSPPPEPPCWPPAPSRRFTPGCPTARPCHFAALAQIVQARRGQVALQAA
jgi:hypothetical protein